MSDLFTPYATLPEMEKLTEHYCQKNVDRSVLVTNNIPITQADMKLMRKYFESYINMTGNVSAYFDVRLALIVSWIFAEKYHYFDFEKYFIDWIEHLPQHHVRSYLDLFAATILEFDLETFGEDYEDIAGLIHVVKKQAKA